MSTGNAYKSIPQAVVDEKSDIQLSTKSSPRTRTASNSASSSSSSVNSANGLNINLILATSVIVFGSSFLFGYNIGVLNQPKKFIIDFYNETFRNRYDSEVSEGTLTVAWSLTTALFIPGGMIGSFLGGWMADRIGRTRTILASHVFTIVGAILSCTCVVASSPEMLMVGRVLVGITSGMANCVAPMILSEIAPFNYRGAFGTVHQLSVTIGIFLSSVFGMTEILGTSQLWPFLILVEAIPAIVTLIVLPFLHDTPRFLMLVRRNRTAALKAMQFYRKSQDVAGDMKEMDDEGKTKSDAADDEATTVLSSAAAKTGVAEKSYTMVQLFQDASIRMPLFIACMLVIIQQFSGINAVFFYSRSIFENAKIAAPYIPFAVIGTNAVNVLMTVIAVPLMDKAGRRLLLIIPMSAMIVDLILMTICLVLQQSHPSLSYLSVVCVIVYVICFAVGLGPIPLFICSELFRQGPRPMAMAVVGVTMWTATFVIAMVFEPLQAAAGKYTFVVFIVLLVGFTIFLYFFCPETKNKTFEEIASHFSKGNSSTSSSSPSSSKSSPTSENAIV
jgi:SP family facilitated glucose transporter-like MFS transporter 1